MIAASGYLKGTTTKEGEESIQRGHLLHRALDLLSPKVPESLELAICIGPVSQMSPLKSEHAIETSTTPPIGQ
ncbi:hypothetical protein UY3_02363 [Chelonia mydas]|uniref:Uncharacterized protein n=1 Tax=Chelonia mydas TaxID=8469 RepID=M7CHI7_CHEMY|nr:hypothetical protein UY3_02363 [Chelonia mydas]